MSLKSKSGSRSTSGADPGWREHVGDQDASLSLFPGADPSRQWWLNPKLSSYWVPPVFLGLLIYFGPIDSAVRWPMLKEFCDVMLRWFPFLGNHATFSAFPSYITVVKCVTFAAIPLLIALPFLFVWRDANKCLEARLSRGSLPVPRFFEVVGLGLVVMVIVGNWVVGADPDPCVGCTTSSVLGLSLIHMGVALVLTLFPIAICTALYVRAGLAHHKHHGGRN
jgi:hypothetical protein